MIRLIKKSDFYNLEKFSNEAYGKNHILHNQTHTTWQFKKNPFLKKTEISVVIYEYKHRIVSHLGFIPVKLKFFNTTKKALWHVSFFTLEQFRGRGLGLKLVKFSNKHYDIAMVLSGSPGTESIYHNIGGKTLGDLRRYVYIIQKNRIEKILGKKIKISQCSVNVQKKGRITRVKNLTSKYDKFWNDIQKRYPITIDRNRMYMYWRYFNHPLIEYHFLILEVEKSITGFVIIRFEDKNKKIKAARIVDMVVKEEFEKEMILSVKEYCNEKIDFIDFFCTGNFYEQSLEELGFFNNNKRKLSIPSVFNPIDTNRRENINFLYADLKKNIKKDILSVENNWFFVKADSDQDRAY